MHCLSDTSIPLFDCCSKLLNSFIHRSIGLNVVQLHCSVIALYSRIWCSSMMALGKPCYLLSGGMIGLGAHTLKNDLSERYMGIAESLTSTCHEAYDRTATKLGPEAFRFTEAIEAKALKSNEKYYILRPEVIESYFIMWRLTKQQKYRDWGWEAVQVKGIFCISFEKSVFPAFYRTIRLCAVFTRAPC